MNDITDDPSTRRKPLVWRCKGQDILVGERTLIMGILNATPDSFSDGGRFFDRSQAIEHALELVRQGADIVDIGGESSRPGADAVSLEEELRRVIPVIEELSGRTDRLISIDTTKAHVARRALEAGAHIVNDISALTVDPLMAEAAAETGAGVILMHMKGTPRTMQAQPTYEDVAGEVHAYLQERLEILTKAGLSLECLAVDPGIGFGKTLEHNLTLLAHLPGLKSLGRPVLVGVSRKSFLGRMTGREPGDRLAASLGAAAYAVLRGADILRVHDVKESCDLARVVDILSSEERRHGALVENSFAGPVGIS
ncbi:MAG TPA: dihydropteroate synthase [Verrucomicrobia bacterium]|nr:MAG: dihydropteroate synthase [Lentisphaerae bacterium GWF2_57_35]HBA85265.1 dihydropteroate synthase [Verrucomicrobiota bacterium]